LQLVILGGCRNDDDRNIVENLERLRAELGLEKQVKFVINASYGELQEYLRTSSVGLHTMTNEHFGIGIVEYMVCLLFS
jgi:alpha-1,2-mannosyltransferase